MVPKNFSVVFILIVHWWQLKGYYYNEESGHQTNKNKKTTEQQRIWFEFEWVMGDESKKNNRLSNDSFDFCVVFSSKNKNRRISNFVFIKDSCFQIRKKNGKWKIDFILNIPTIYNLWNFHSFSSFRGRKKWINQPTNQTELKSWNNNFPINKAKIQFNFNDPINQKKKCSPLFHYRFFSQCFWLDF